MTRVLVSGVVLGQPMGGVRRHNQELLPRLGRLLSEAGGGLCVLAGARGLAFDLPDEVEVIPSDVPPRPIPVRAWRETRVLARIVREREVDVVHTAHLPVPRGLGVPLTLTLHDLRALEGPHSPFSRRLIARQVVGTALERAAAVFTVSGFTARALQERWPAVTPKLVRVPNAADHFQPLPRRPGPDAELLHLGHLEPRKNLELLLRALAADPELPPLRLAGAGKGQEEARLRSLAVELGVDVRFHGPYTDEELPGLLAACAAVVLPSRLEGFGIPALEALRARAPLAVSSAGALPEVAGPEVPTFDPDDAEGCARAIRIALERGPGPAPAGTWDDAARHWFEALP